MAPFMVGHHKSTGRDQHHIEGYPEQLRDHHHQGEAQTTASNTVAKPS
jgi:hypothetical protein